MTYQKILQYAVGPVGAAAVSLLTLPVLAHYFSPEDVGRYAIIQVFLSLSIMLFSLGLHQSYVREYYDYDDKKSLVLMATLPCVVVLAVFFSVYSVIPLSLSELLLDLESPWVSYLILICVTLSVLINQYAHVLRMQDRALLFSFSTVLPRLAFIIAIVVSLYLSQSRDFNDIVLALIISLSATFFLLLVLIPDVRRSFRARVDLGFLRKMLSFGLPLTVGGLAFWGMSSIDRFLLKHFSELSEVAIYSVAVSFAAAGSILTTVFITIWHPLVYKWNKEGIEKDKLQMVLNVMLLAVCACWSLVGFCSWLLKFLLPEYYNLVIYILPLCVSVPLTFLLSEITQIGINIKRKTNLAMVITLFALFVNLAVNFVAIERLGALGAALARAIAFVVFLFARTEVGHHLMPVFNRKSLYLLVSIYLLYSAVFSVVGTSSDLYFSIWLLPLPIVIYKLLKALKSFRLMFPVKG